MLKLKNLLFTLPKPIKHHLLRKLVNLEYKLPKELVFKVAETDSELQQAFQLAHNSYTHANIMKPHSTKMRVTPFHALPGTAVLVAKWNQQVVGTVSVIKDTALKLPSDKIFNLSKLRNTYKKIGEISSLAVSREFTNSNSLITMPLIKYLYDISKDHLGIDALVISTNKKHGDIYEAIFGYKPIEKKKIDSYDFANGKEAVGRYCPLDISLNKKFAETYFAHLPDKKNINKYYFEHKNKNTIFPQRAYFSTSINHWNKKQFERFFLNAAYSLHDLTQKEALSLFNYYQETEVKKIFKEHHILSNDMQRTQRFEVDFPGQMLGSKNSSSTYEMLNIFVQTASLEGCQIHGPKTLKVGEKITIQVKISNTEKAKLRCVVQWIKGPRAGLKITNHPKNWIHCINHLSSLWDTERETTFQECL